MKVLVSKVVNKTIYMYGLFRQDKVPGVSEFQRASLKATTPEARSDGEGGEVKL